MPFKFYESNGAVHWTAAAKQLQLLNRWIANGLVRSKSSTKLLPINDNACQTSASLILAMVGQKIIENCRENAEIK